MGKVKYDPMFDDVSKRVGNYVHAKWKGEHIIRKYNGERGPSTPSQIEVQNAFKVTVELWRQLPALIKQSWTPYTTGKPVTELNLFVAENVNRQRAGQPYLMTKGNGPDNLEGYIIDATVAGQVSIDFDTPAVPVNLTVILQRITGGAGTAEFEVRRDIYTGTKPVILTGLTSGAEYYLYCFVTEGLFNASTLISESEGFRITVA